MRLSLSLLPGPANMHTETEADCIICECLKITRFEVESAIVTSDSPSVRSVLNLTGAGSGCTSCHRAIRKMIADQCPFASSPTCVMR